MTNRLNILERERERLQQALSGDPHWQALRRLRPDAAAVGISLRGMSRAGAEALAGNALFQDYVKVTDEIARLQQAATVAEPDTAETAAFRTRVTVKQAATPTGPDEAGDAAPSPSRIDDLTAIRRIDRKLAAELNSIGVFSFGTIANWDRYEVRRVRDALDLGKRIWRENWIEQAALLDLRAAGAPSATPRVVAATVRAEAPAETGITGRDILPPVVLPEILNNVDAPPEPDATLKPAEPVTVVSDPAPPKPQPGLPETEPQVRPAPAIAALPVVAEAAAQPAPQPAPAKTFKAGRRPRRLPAPAARRFVYIRGVSDSLSNALRGAGVKSIADIATWTRADVKWFQAILGDEAQISRDQWIEQATLLTKGIWTRHALRVVNGETRLLIEPPQPVVTMVPAVAPINPGGVAASAEASAAAVAVEAVAPPEPKLAVAPAAPKADIAQPTLAGEPPAAAEASADPVLAQPVATEAPVETMRALPDAAERFNPLRGLTTVIALGKIKRPPPDLGLRRRHTDLPIADDPAVSEIVVATEPERPDPLVAASRIEAPLECAFDAAADNPAAEPVISDPPAPAESIGDEAPIPPELIEFGADADWDDAEALVIRKVEKAPSPRVVPPPIPRIAEPRVPQSAFAAPTPRPASDNAWDDDDGDLPWGDEAEVVIVSRPRPPAVDHTPPPPAADPGNTEKPRALRGLSERIAQHRHTPIADDATGRPAGHVAFTEEATVTIIRAEASATTESAIFPHEIANDADAPGDSAPPVRQFEKRGLRSRFFKALTGD